MSLCSPNFSILLLVNFRENNEGLKTSEALTHPLPKMSPVGKIDWGITHIDVSSKDCMLHGPLIWRGVVSKTKEPKGPPWDYQQLGFCYSLLKQSSNLPTLRRLF